VPISLGILVGLFLVQKRGTARVGAMFGPAMVVWFVMIAALGVPWVVRAQLRSVDVRRLSHATDSAVRA
jgi:KUP system potassium uptake protein